MAPHIRVWIDQGNLLRQSDFSTWTIGTYVQAIYYLINHSSFWLWRKDFSKGVFCRSKCRDKVAEISSSIFCQVGLGTLELNVVPVNWIEPSDKLVRESLGSHLDSSRGAQGDRLFSSRFYLYLLPQQRNHSLYFLRCQLSFDFDCILCVPKKPLIRRVWVHVAAVFFSAKVCKINVQCYHKSEFPFWFHGLEQSEKNTCGRFTTRDQPKTHGFGAWSS